MLSSLIEDEKERRGGVGVERQAAAPPHAALSVVSFPSSSSLHWIRVASKSTVTYKASEKKRKRQQSKKAGGRTGAMAVERQAGRRAGRQAYIVDGSGAAAAAATRLHADVCHFTGFVYDWVTEEIKEGE